VQMIEGNVNQGPLCTWESCCLGQGPDTRLEFISSTFAYDQKDGKKGCGWLFHGWAEKRAGCQREPGLERDTGVRMG